MNPENEKQEKGAEKVEQLRPVLEEQKSFEDLSKSLEYEVAKNSEEFLKQDDKVKDIEQSVNLSNLNSVDEVKKELDLEKKLVALNSHSEELKKQTQQLIGWLRLDDPKFDENRFYRVVDEIGYKDYEENKVVRSSPTGSRSDVVGKLDIGGRPTSFPSFARGEPDLMYAEEGEENYIFESDIPMYKMGEKNPVTGSIIRGRHWAYRPIDQKTGEVIKTMTPEMIKNVYKIDKKGAIYVQKKEFENSSESEKEIENIHREVRKDTP